MRAVRRTDRGIEVVELPTPVGSGVRVRVRSVGICQTDLNLSAMGPMPATLGHEFAGLLDDDTPVAIEPMVPCERCEACRRGDYHFCALGYSMLLGIGLEGGMADEVRVPERCLVPLPRGLDAADACLVEPLAVNLHALALARLGAGARVAVVGTGITGFGLLAAAGALFRGCRVDVETEIAHHRPVAEELGAGVLAPDDGGHYDLVIEADGSEASIARAAERCRPGGTLLLVAGYYANKVFPTLPCQTKELTLVWGTYYGHHAGGRDVDAAASLLALRPGIARAMIRHRLPLDAAAEAFALCRSDAPTVKVVLEP